MHLRSPIPQSSYKGQNDGSGRPSYHENDNLDGGCPCCRYLAHTLKEQSELPDFESEDHDLSLEPAVFGQDSSGANLLLPVALVEPLPATSLDAKVGKHLLCITFHFLFST